MVLVGMQEGKVSLGPETEEQEELEQGFIMASECDALHTIFTLIEPFVKISYCYCKNRLDSKN